MDELLAEFVTETGEGLDQLDVELVRFEQEPNNAEMLNTIFRLVHTVKGTCGFIGLNRLAKLAHAAETLMGQYRDGAPVTVEGVSVILASIDRIKEILTGLDRDGTEPPGSDADLIGRLQMLALAEADTMSKGAYDALGTVPIAAEDARGDLPPVQAALDEIERTWRAAPGPDPAESAKELQSNGASVVEVNAREAQARAQTVRVSVDTLEHLMTTVSELVLTRNQLLDLVRRTGESEFKSPLQRLSTVTAELQEGIMQARMQPIANAWQKLPRLVRELSLELDKKIELDIQLLDLEGARGMLERLADSILTVVVIQVGARLFGVLVDSVFRTEEIVVKPMSSLLRDVGMFSGNTILGDGSVIMIIDPNALGSMVGSVDGQAEAANALAAAAAVAEEDKTALLLFRAGSNTMKAVPISLITRLEEIDLGTIERCNDEDVVQYRGALMPLVYMQVEPGARDDGVQPVLVFTEGGRPVGLAIDEIVDIVEERLDIELKTEAPGVIGAAIIKGKAAEIVDVSHYLGRGLGQRLDARGGQADREVRLLLVDDSQFFRNMLAPLLKASGYDVTLAASAGEVLALKDGGAMFDLIVSDLDMPGMDGIALAERIKSDPRWEKIPLIALSSHTNPLLVEKSRAAGFVSYVGKFDRQTLMSTLQECCRQWGVAA
jgi:chemotaxis protein histidine kinase CheA